MDVITTIVVASSSTTFLSFVLSFFFPFSFFYSSSTCFIRLLNTVVFDSAEYTEIKWDKKKFQEIIYFMLEKNVNARKQTKKGKETHVLANVPGRIELNEQSGKKKYKEIEYTVPMEDISRGLYVIIEDR